MDPSYSTPTHPAEPVDSASSELASAPTEIAVSGTHVDEDIVAEDSDQGGDGESEDEDEASRYTGYAQLGDEAFGDFETASVEASDDESTVATTEPTGEESKSEAETSYLHIGNRRIEVVVKPDRAISDEKADLIKSIMARLQLSDRAVPEWAKHVPEKAWMPVLASANGTTEAESESAKAAPSESAANTPTSTNGGF